MKLIALILSLVTILFSSQEDVRISGIVTTSGGRPVAGATVVLQPGQEGIVKVAGTDNLGAFQLDGLPEGQYALWVAKDGYDVHSEILQLRAGEKRDGERYNLLESGLKHGGLVSNRDRTNFENGIVLLRAEKADAALRMFNSFLGKYPYLVRAHHNVGLCYAEKASRAYATTKKEEAAKYERTARRHFAVALQRYPDFSEARKALADSYIRSKIMANAATEYARLVSQLKDDPSLWFTFGEVNSYLQRLGRAETAFRKVLELEPAFADAHAKIGAIQMANGDLKGAVMSFQTFLRMAPDSDMRKITEELLEQCRQQLKDREISEPVGK